MTFLSSFVTASEIMRDAEHPHTPMHMPENHKRNANKDKQTLTASAANSKLQKVLLINSPDMHMTLRSKVDLTPQHPLSAITPWELADLAVLQVPVSLLDLGVTIVQGNVPHNLEDLCSFNDLRTSMHASAAVAS